MGMSNDANGESEQRPSVVVTRPVLNLPEEVLLGYLALDEEERRFTEHALAQHSAMVAHWYRLLTLFRLACTSPVPHLDDDEAVLARLLRLQFIAAAGGTVKLVLDATLAGYYAQAFTLIRHLFETWIRLEFLHIQPERARAWYVGDDGSPPQRPNRGTIHSVVRNGSSPERQSVFGRVEQTIKDLNEMAHPSPYTLQQTIGVRPNQYNVGANYDPDLCAKALHEGASGLTLLVGALARDIPQPEQWSEELRAVVADYEWVLLGEREAQEARARDKEHHASGGE